MATVIPEVELVVPRCFILATEVYGVSYSRPHHTLTLGLAPPPRRSSTTAWTPTALIPILTLTSIPILTFALTSL